MARRDCSSSEVNTQILFSLQVRLRKTLKQMKLQAAHKENSLVMCRSLASRGISSVVEDGRIRGDTTDKIFSQGRQICLVHNSPMPSPDIATSNSEGTGPRGLPLLSNICREVCVGSDVIQGGSRVHRPREGSQGL